MLGLDRHTLERLELFGSTERFTALCEDAAQRFGPTIEELALKGPGLKAHSERRKLYDFVFAGFEHDVISAFQRAHVLENSIQLTKPAR